MINRVAMEFGVESKFINLFLQSAPEFRQSHLLTAMLNTELIWSESRPTGSQ